MPFVWPMLRPSAAASAVPRAVQTGGRITCTQRGRLAWGQHIHAAATAAVAAVAAEGGGDAVRPAGGRRAAWNTADSRPFSDFLTDGFGRQHDYLRISVTERCNLRCLYCMPAEGVMLSPAPALLTTPEIVLLARVFVAQGVRKIRLTGGEPTVRRDIVALVEQLGALRVSGTDRDGSGPGLRELCLTTNGLALHRKLDALASAGLTGVNLSLDTLDARRFEVMTRRDGYAAVRRTLDRLLAMNRAGAGLRLKINCVVVRGRNEEEMGDFVALTRDHDLEVRFIEYMPFDGNRWQTHAMVGYTEMLERVSARYPTLRRCADAQAHDTSKTYEVPGFAGRVGFITSMTNHFCGGCNRLRITSDGNLKVCLFGDAEVSLRDIVREVNGGVPIDEAALAALVRRARDATTAAATSDPAAAALPDDAAVPLDRVLPNAPELLDVIGMAVKRKKARHAGLGELEHMKNRPMILIGNVNARNRGYHGNSGNGDAGDVDGMGLVQSWDAPAAWDGQRGRARTWVLPPPPPLLSGGGAPQASGPLPWTCRGRAYSTKRASTTEDVTKKLGGGRRTAVHDEAAPRLTHISASGTAHMVSVAEKAVTARTAAAACTVRFASPVAAALVRANDMAKGDVLGVARIAGIMAAKRTADLIPLCHPLALSQVAVDLYVAEGSGGGDNNDFGHVAIRATVRCEGKTGVEMEALTAASVAALTVFDMCKAVDKGMRIDGLRVVFKEGGKSGRWEEPRTTTTTSTPDTRIVSEGRRGMRVRGDGR